VVFPSAWLSRAARRAAGLARAWPRIAGRRRLGRALAAALSYGLGTKVELARPGLVAVQQNIDPGGGYKAYGQSFPSCAA
jgi:hypothetical protein